MSAKDTILDFVNYLFMIAIIAITIFILIHPGYFERFQEFMRASAPLSFLSLVFLIKLKFSRDEVRRSKNDGDTDLVLYLTSADKMKTEIIVFLLPIIIVIIPLAAGRGFDPFILLQAGAIFALMYIWQKSLFNKQR